MKRLPALFLAAFAVSACQQPGALSASNGASEKASIAIGARLIEANQPEMALDAFNRVIAEQGVTVEAMLGVGVSYYRMGRPGIAMRFFQSAVELDPNQPIARNNLGVALYQDGAIPAARSEFERAYALTNGLDPTIRTNLGIAEVADAASREEVVVDDSEFDVIQYGQGVYRLQRRASPPTDADKKSTSDTEAQS